MGVFFRQGDKLIPMREQVYQAEAVLQQLLAESPAVLAGDEDSGKQRWLLVGTADQRVGPDYVFLDQDAVPTLVKVTRSADSNASRNLVGQMVDYAANVIAYQDPARLRAMVEARCLDQGRYVQDVLHEDLGLDMEPGHFWEHLRTNMTVGRLRLIFVADAIPADLRRIVEFMNEQMSPTEVLALEIRQYVEAGGLQQTLVSRVFGWTAAAQRRKGRGSPQVAWSWDDFRHLLPKPQFEIVRALARELETAITRRGLDWTADLRESAVVYQRPRGYSTVAIDLSDDTTVKLAIKLPDEPRDALKLADPYPDLQDEWNPTTRQWSWQIASLDKVPEVERAIEIAEQYHSSLGSRLLAETPEAPIATARPVAGS